MPKGWLFILLLPFLVNCSSPAPVEKSAEELRVEASRHIDTTAVCAVVNLDSIEGRTLLDGLSAEAWILVDDSLGLLLSEKNANQRMFPASLTKMMTSLLALEQGNMSDSIEITEDVFLSKDSRTRLGDRYLLGNLVLEMMLQSANDAASIGVELSPPKHHPPPSERFTDVIALSFSASC